MRGIACIRACQLAGGWVPRSSRHKSLSVIPEPYFEIDFVNFDKVESHRSAFVLESLPCAVVSLYWSTGTKIACRLQQKLHTGHDEEVIVISSVCARKKSRTTRPSSTLSIFCTLVMPNKFLQDSCLWLRALLILRATQCCETSREDQSGSSILATRNGNGHLIDFKRQQKDYRTQAMHAVFRTWAQKATLRLEAVARTRGLAHSHQEQHQHSLQSIQGTADTR